MVTLVDHDIHQTTFDVFLPKRYEYIETNYNVRDTAMAYYGTEKKFDFEEHQIEFMYIPDCVRLN